jgi:four helix bundle protein
MQDFRDLKVWEKSHQFVLGVYASTAVFPREELYGLTSQLRRAAVSVPTNIAEGCGRGTDADFGRFLQIAMGSACEAEYLLLLSRDLRYLNDEHYQRANAAVTEIKRMLSALLNTVRLTAES